MIESGFRSIEFNEVITMVKDFCHSKQAREKCDQIKFEKSYKTLELTLEQTDELKNLLATNAYIPSVEHDAIDKQLSLLKIEGCLILEKELIELAKTVYVSNTWIRFLKEKKTVLPALLKLVQTTESCEYVITEIERIIDEQGQVRDNASSDLNKIRKELSSKKRESNRIFEQFVSRMKKDGFIRENEETYLNGRRTVALLIEHKSQVSGFVHGKSATGKTVFLEPANTVNINNEIVELEFSEQIEIQKILRDLCKEIRKYLSTLKFNYELLIELDFLKAKASLGNQMKAILPKVNTTFEFKLLDAYHPLLFLKNKKRGQITHPMNLELTREKRMLLISGSNAGGKTVALKTVGLIQCMFQHGLLVPMKDGSELCFFDEIFIDVGDNQSIENELSTYSAKLKSMLHIIETANEASLVLMDEFGSGTDPELGGNIAEAIFENLEKSQCLAVITTHYGNLKLRATQLNGCINGSMLFDLKELTPLYQLNIGEPGSSYTFEVAEKIGFPSFLLQRAKEKADPDKIKFNQLLKELHFEKIELRKKKEELKIAIEEQFSFKKKYEELFLQWRDKIEAEKTRKQELVRLGYYGEKYLKFMEDWTNKEERKNVIKRFIDSLTAETKKKKQQISEQQSEKNKTKKISSILTKLKVGDNVRILKSNKIGIVEKIQGNKVLVNSGLIHLNVGIENIEIVKIEE